MAEIVVEVVGPLGGYGDDLSGRTAIPERLEKRIDEIGDSIAEVAKRLESHLEAVSGMNGESRWHLGEVQVSFGLDLQAETGVVVVKSKVGCTFTATLTWSSLTDDR